MPKGIYKRKPEEIERLRKQVKIFEFKKGHAPTKGATGMRQSDDTRKKHSESLKRVWAEGGYRKVRRIQIKYCLDCDVALSYVSCKKNGKYCSKHAHIGERNPFYGKEHSKETKGKNREAHLGDKNWNWIGGIDAGKAYRARKLGAEGAHTVEEWEDLKQKYNFMCLCCKKQEPEIKLTEDHIIPLSKEGSNYIENIQPLCQSCNSIKYNKVIDFTLLYV